MTDILTDEQVAEIEQRWPADANYNSGFRIARDDINALLRDRVALKAERDLAIAHDRQPYPTPDAYEKVCAALSNTKARLAEVEKERDALKSVVVDVADLEDRPFSVTAAQRVKVIGDNAVECFRRAAIEAVKDEIRNKKNWLLASEIITLLETLNSEEQK